MESGHGQTPGAFWLASLSYLMSLLRDLTSDRWDLKEHHQWLISGLACGGARVHTHRQQYKTLGSISTDKKAMMYRGLETWPVAKRTYCPCTESGFESQHPGWEAPAPRDPMHIHIVGRRHSPSNNSWSQQRQTDTSAYQLSWAVVLHAFNTSTWEEAEAGSL